MLLLLAVTLVHAIFNGARCLDGILGTTGSQKEIFIAMRKSIKYDLSVCTWWYVLLSIVVDRIIIILAYVTVSHFHSVRTHVYP